MLKEYTQSYFASAGEANAQGELALPWMIGNIIDIATKHANSLGIGNPSMEHLGCGWVLSRLTIEMKRWPRANESYTLTTWIETWNRHFSGRCFAVKDERGDVVGYARSIWMVIDTATRGNAGTAHLNLPEGMIHPESDCPIARQAKHRPIDGEPVALHRVEYTDIDFYRHVNTLIYSRFVLNSYSLDEFDRNFIGRFEMSFMHEGQYGHTLELRRGEPDPDGLTPFAINDGPRPIVYIRLRPELRT